MKNKKSTITDLPNDIRRAIPIGKRSAYVQEIIKQAIRGEFHDFKNTTYVCGKTQLVHMLHTANEPALLSIRQAVINGEYDESPDADDISNMKKDWAENGGNEAEWKTLFGNN